MSTPRRARSALGLVAVLTALAVLGAAFATAAGAMVITEFPLPAGATPQRIVAGPDGNMWFTDPGTDTIGRIGMTGQASEFGLGITPNAGLNGIAAGPDGNLWFTERSGHKVGRITPAGAITEFSTGLTSGADVYGITPGPGGLMWFTETNGKVGHVNPATGTIEELTTVPVATYTDIVQGPDGNLWYVSPTKATISRLTPTGTATAFGPLSSSDCAVGAPTPCPYPESIAVGPDGNLWFNEVRGNAIGRITPSGGISEFSDGLTHGAEVATLAAGPEGNLWFTEPGVNQIGRITPTGTITEFSSGLSPKANPVGIALGPDQNLWITEPGIGKVARVIPDVPPVVATTGAAAVGSRRATMTGVVRPRAADTHFFFEYGPTAAYGKSTAAGDGGTGDSPVPVGTVVSGLRPHHEYHYRIVASNANGVSYGADVAFWTKKRRKGRRAKLTVRPFQTYLADLPVGSHRRRIVKIIVTGVHRGEHVSFSCSHCQGKPKHGRKRARRGRVAFHGLRIVVSRRSLLRIAVAGKNKSKRVKAYAIDIRSGESKLRGQRCFLPGRHKSMSCAAASGHGHKGHGHGHKGHKGHGHKKGHGHGHKGRRHRGGKGSR